jgi:CRISPR-associated protein Cas1
MPTIYVAEPGAEVRKKGERLHVCRQGRVIVAVPLRLVERLVLLGPVQLSAEAARKLLAARIPVVFGSVRGTYYGVLSAGCEDAGLILRQVTRREEQQYRLETARRIVAVKVVHQARVLRRHARNHPNPTLSATVERLEQLAGTLEKRSAVGELMGVEGHASALYFEALSGCLRQEGLGFTGRNRRPPRDPVNSVLSLGYMLVLGEAVTALAAEGLHPGIGFLHEVDGRRPALALDLLEVARQPVVDRLTLSLFNRRVFTPADFEGRPETGVRLRPESLKRYLEFYERTMATSFTQGPEGRRGTFRDWLRRQAGTLRKAVQTGTVWSVEALEI